MSGVRNGTRLEQLLQLRRQVDLQIEVERHHEATRSGLEVFQRPPDGRRRANQAVAEQYADRLANLGVTTWKVRSWAYAEGLIDHLGRGRVSAELIDAYEAAHPQEEAS